MRIVALSLLAVLMMAAGPQADKGKDADLLEGTWNAVSHEEGGQAEQKAGEDKYVLVFKGERFAIKRGDKVLMEGTFSVDPSKELKLIDMKVEKSEGHDLGGKVSRGIYDLDGDHLKWCSAPPGDEKRPADFQTKDSNFLSVVFERAKP